MSSYFLKEGKLQSFEIYKAPVFKELKNKDWVIWGYTKDWDGDTNWNNLQPDYYEWLYNSSSKHRAIVNRKTLFINGKGLGTKDKGLTVPERVEIKNFAFKIDNSEIVKKWALNSTKVGGFAYEVIANKKGDKIEPHYINIKNVRRSKPTYDSNGKLDPIIYYYTANWAGNKPEENPDFTTFEPFTWGEESMDSNKRYLVYYSADDETLYPIPEYTAAIPYVAADYEVSNFVYNNTKNGFAASYLVNFYNGEPDETQKGQIERLWKSKMHGSDNAGDPILSFNEDKDSGVEVTPLASNGQDDRFVNLNKQIREEIFSGHTVNPIVVGLEGNAGFNNNADEARTAVEDFQNYYVQGKQRIFEQHLNAIRAFNDIKGEVFIQRLDPIQAQFSAAEIMQISTTDEARAIVGLPVAETESNKVADALGTISPLVATKVLETMTAEEIRAIVGLITPKGGVITRTDSTTEKVFSADEIDDKIISTLAVSGQYRDSLQFIKSKEVFAKDIEEARAMELEFLDAIEIIILRLLEAEPDMPLKNIAKSVGKPLKDIEVLVASLKEQGLINEDGEVTDEGTKEPDEIFTVYSYELRANAPSLIGESRPFCKNLVNLSKFKVWTIEDIDRMNNGVAGLDVFTSRGGWYTVKGTNRHQPRCRHIWKSHLVRVKPQ